MHHSLSQHTFTDRQNPETLIPNLLWSMVLMLVCDSRQCWLVTESSRMLNILSLIRCTKKNYGTPDGYVIWYVSYRCVNLYRFFGKQTPTENRPPRRGDPLWWKLFCIFIRSAWFILVCCDQRHVKHDKEGKGAETDCASAQYTTAVVRKLLTLDQCRCSAEVTLCKGGQPVKNIVLTLIYNKSDLWSEETAN